MASNPNKKYESSASTCTTEGSSASSSPPSPVNPHNTQQPANNAPKYGTLVPNRIFVGGISGNTTETELAQLFSAYGNVKATKVISDRAGVSKGYGFVTFETEEEAKRLMRESECIVLKERKLNIAPAIKKQPFSRSYEVTSPPTVPGNTIYYQNGMPYTFHNGMAYFAPTTPPHPTTNAPMGGAGDPNAMYQTAYVSPAPTAPTPAAAAAATATYPLIYPCTAQPVFMSQQFPFQPMPPPAQNSQYVYTATSSPTNGAPGGGPPPPGPPLTAMPPQHYYGPSPMNPTELYYNVTPVAAGQAFGPLMTASPEGILYETMPTSVEASNNPSAEECSSNSSQSDVQRNGNNNKGQDPSNVNGVTHPDRVNNSSRQPSPSLPVGRLHSDTPPVVSLLKLQQQQQQQQQHQQQAGDEPEGEQPRSASVPYTMSPPSGATPHHLQQQYSASGPTGNSPMVPYMYQSMVPIGNASLGSPLYMNHHMNYPPYISPVPPMFADQFRPVLGNSAVPPHMRSEKRGSGMEMQMSKQTFINNNNPMAPDNNDKGGPLFSPFQKRAYTRNGNNFMRECPRYSSPNNARYAANGPNSSCRNPVRYPAPPNAVSRRRNIGGGRGVPLPSRSPPPAPYSPLNCHVPEMHHASVSPQFHPGGRHIYYQPCNSTNTNNNPNNVGSGGHTGSTGGGGAGLGGSGSAGQRRFAGNGRKSASVNGNRSGAVGGGNGNSGASGKYPRVGVNGVQALNSAKMVGGIDKGGAGDAPSLMPITPPNTPHTTDNSDSAVQEACHEMQALAL